ncbi:unnamed protein product [Heligmosomoides polygyrus]|uniref:Ketoacyl_synth_N domain-containing protein n=1 Tax=Heligmosomoides polygyrus TaxID=6339 RepID=A0A183G0Q7_HELPZ|nr:unnamed protein product [Heligmosomoides polygyrus]
MAELPYYHNTQLNVKCPSVLCGTANIERPRRRIACLPTPPHLLRLVAQLTLRRPGELSCRATFNAALSQFRIPIDDIWYGAEHAASMAPWLISERLREPK